MKATVVSGMVLMRTGEDKEVFLLDRKPSSTATCFVRSAIFARSSVFFLSSTDSSFAPELTWVISSRVKPACFKAVIWWRMAI